MGIDNKSAITILSHQAGDHLTEDTIKSIIIDTLFHEVKPIRQDILCAKIEALFGVLISGDQILSLIHSLIDTSLVMCNTNGELDLSDRVRTDTQLKRLQDQSL